MTIAVNLTAEDFRSFTLFDTFRRRKMWRAPVTFSLILGLSACVCFFMNHVEGAVMLGSVLLVVGLGMPISYFSSFFLSLRKQIRTLGLHKGIYEAYTLVLTEKSNGIHIENGREQVDYSWKDVYHVYRSKHATYLYITATRAFILPHWCIEDVADAKEGREQLWKLIEKKIKADKRTIL